MFRINAFGQRVYVHPRLRFVETPEGGDPGQGSPKSDGKNPEGSDKGYPEGTPLEQMTVEQQLAYHKYHSRKHETAERALQQRQADFDKYKADSEELAQLRAKNATAEEKALEEARLEGENLGAQRYLKDAVMGRFQAITGRKDEEVAKAFEHIDAASFVDDKGDIQLEKLHEFAEAFGSKSDTDGSRDPIAEALARQRQAGGGSGSSISEKRKEIRESMTRKKA